METKNEPVEENSIIMPDVPNFSKQHFEHFQRSAGHRSTGETLLYQAGKEHWVLKTELRGHQTDVKCQISKILQQRNNSPAENYHRIVVSDQTSLFHKLICIQFQWVFLLRECSCLSFVRPWPCTWFHVMRFCILCNICTLGIDRRMDDGMFLS